MEASTGRVDFPLKQPARWRGLRLEASGVLIMKMLPHTGGEESVEAVARIITGYFHGQGQVQVGKEVCFYHVPSNRKPKSLSAVLRPTLYESCW